MLVLLDTHALLWALSGSPRLSAKARDVIEDERNAIMVSVVSAWEIEIKKALGQLEAPDDLEAVVDDIGFIKRLVTFSDVRRLHGLPVHHRDPFDRMLIAQALRDNAPIVTTDIQIARYPVTTIW